MIDHLLVPHDLTELADVGLAAVRGLAFGKLHVAHVLRRVDPAIPGWIWSRDEDEPRAEHARRTLRKRLDGLGFPNAVIHVRHGDPATRLVELATEIGAGMIVVPSHSRTGFRRFVLGSVAEHVARFARCPVLILPASAPAANLQPVHDLLPTDQVDVLACAICEEVAARPGFLTAARIAIPAGEPPEWWEQAMVERLGAAGIAYVDLVLTPAAGARAEILALRFEDGFV